MKRGRLAVKQCVTSARMMGEPWRCIVDPPGGAARMMAVDEALLWGVSQGGLPVLRLYGWSPVAFSLGRHQDAQAVLDCQRCQRDGVAIVRRMTGGGAIYHGMELTYSLAVPLSYLPETAQRVKDSFRFLTAGLLLFYQRLGLAPAYAGECHDGRTLGERTALCFAGSEWFDIVIAGKKIGGNAQRRTRQLVLQHGSIPLQPMMHEALVYLKEADQHIPEGSVSLAELGVTACRQDLAQLLASCMFEAFGATAEYQKTSDSELLRAAWLEEHKYKQASWNLEGVACADYP